MSFEEEEGHVKAAISSYSFVHLLRARAAAAAAEAGPLGPAPLVQGALWPMQYPQTIPRVTPGFLQSGFAMIAAAESLG